MEAKEEEKLHGYTAREWMKAVLDLLDGNSYWHEIQYRTGMSEERCKELEAMFNSAHEDRDWRGY